MARQIMKCVQKCEGQYSDTEMGLFLDPEKYNKFERQRFGLAKFQVISLTSLSLVLFIAGKGLF